MYLVLRQCTYIQCGCVFHVSVFITVFVCFENIKVGKKQLVSYFDTTYIVKSSGINFGDFLHFSYFIGDN